MNKDTVIMLGNWDCVGRCLDSLSQGLRPYVQKCLERQFGEEWESTAVEESSLRRPPQSPQMHWDSHLLLTMMWDHWNAAFRHQLGHRERSLVSELREFRNLWAHQGDFSFDDTYRCLDSIERLLDACGCPESAEVHELKRELMFEEYSRGITERIVETKARRKRISTITVYMSCSIALSFALVPLFPTHGWWVVVPMNLMFLILSYHVWKEKTIVVGPHDCLDCGRIIYTSNCPYCHPRSETIAQKALPSRARRSTSSKSGFPA